MIENQECIKRWNKVRENLDFQSYLNKISRNIDAATRESAWKDIDYLVSKHGAVRIASIIISKGETDMNTLTIAAATAALTVPADTRNNNCVQDAQWRLRDALKLAANHYKDEDAAPSYVVKAVADLKSWL